MNYVCLTERDYQKYHGGEGGEPLSNGLIAVPVMQTFYRILERDSQRDGVTVDEAYRDFLIAEDLEG